MRITIYGVGRSGTKAIQLYLSYLIAKREKSVWINYEPYFWLTRKTNAINFEGFYYHSTSPHLITDAQQLSSGHARFLKKLANHDCSIVTKFIRGNGRIKAINEIIKPDYCFIIIRDLYEVLLSVMKTEWDFWSVGWDYSISWDKFVKEVSASGMIENFDWCIERINDRIDQNAFYWYVMNIAALQSLSSSTFLIDYKNIKEIESIAHTFFGKDSDNESINSKKFSGDFLHENYPLKGMEKIHLQSNILNQVLYKTQLFRKYGWFIPSSNIGSKVMINKDFYLEELKTKGTNIVIEKKEVFEFFNNDIKKRLTDVTTKSSASKEQVI